MGERQVNLGFLVEPEPPGRFAPDEVGLGVPGKVGAVAFRVCFQEQFLCAFGQPVSPQPVFVVGAQELFSLQLRDCFFRV